MRPLSRTLNPPSHRGITIRLAHHSRSLDRRILLQLENHRRARPGKGGGLLYQVRGLQATGRQVGKSGGGLLVIARCKTGLSQPFRPIPA
jgi:hypothetical protein